MTIAYRPWLVALSLALAGIACSLSPTSETTTPPADPTAIDVATEAPTQIASTEAPTEAAAPTEASAFVGATACDHLYLPLRVGATWEYGGDYGRLVQTVTAVEGDASQATATLSSQTGDSPADTLTYVCTPEGIRRGDSVYAGNLTYTNTFIEGFEVPPADLLVPGHEWSYTLEEDANGQVTVLTRDSKVLEASTVDINGQSFDALVIDYDQNGRAGQQIWAKGVGVYSYGGSSGFTLESYTPGTP